MKEYWRALNLFFHWYGRLLMHSSDQYSLISFFSRYEILCWFQNLISLELNYWDLVGDVAEGSSFLDLYTTGFSCLCLLMPPKKFYVWEKFDFLLHFCRFGLEAI